MKLSLWILLFICGTMTIVIAAILGFLNLKESVTSEILKQIVPQLITGLIIAVASFWSAYGLYRIQDEQKVIDSRIDSFIKIHNEVSENRFTLDQENRRDRCLVKLPLKTTAWDTGKNQAPIKTDNLLDGLKLLYNDIERYNWHVEFINFKVREQNLTPTNVPEEIWQSTESIMNNIYKRLEEFEKLTAREMVLLKERTKESFEKRFGPWKDKSEISYFTRKKNP